MWYAYTHTHTHTHKYYSAIKKKENFPFVAAWMDLDSTMLNEMSVRERQIYDITYMWNLKLQQTSEYKKKEADSQMNKLVVTRKGNIRVGSGRHKQNKFLICNHQVIKWENFFNRVLLRSETSYFLPSFLVTVLCDYCNNRSNNIIKQWVQE